ncbi:MAG TPA: replication-associated recombination protein A [Planctomycetota bacterium]|nr:replication-associated recombination protein A [Planctomycetota bacterium]
MTFVPLAERLRPKRLDDVVGQDAVIGEGSPLRAALGAKRLPSFLLWGPPGSGKTTIARLVAEEVGAAFEPLSAVTAGVKDVREVIRRAAERETPTILFVDEVHRFNKAQQDAFLHAVETGEITLIGATTENPSFELNSPLLSRLKIFVLQPLDRAALETILDRGLKELGTTCDDEARGMLLRIADGDARALLTTLDLAAQMGPITGTRLREGFKERFLRYDATGEEHYNLISALHKSVRASDPDAALYWLARMLEGGEDPLYVAGRLVRAASEDIGNADPQALALAVAAKEAVEFIGMPEAAVALAQIAVYLATAPKSNSAYLAYGEAAKDAKEKGTLPVPLPIRNAPTRLMKDLGYGKGYVYDHDTDAGVSGQQCLPDELKDKRYYEPGRFGFEREIAKRIAYWRKMKGGGAGEGLDAGAPPPA